MQRLGLKSDDLIQQRMTSHINSHFSFGFNVSTRFRFVYFSSHIRIDFPKLQDFHIIIVQIYLLYDSYLLRFLYFLICLGTKLCLVFF